MGILLAAGLTRRREDAKTRRKIHKVSRRVSVVRRAADGSLRVSVLQAAGLTRRREDAKKNTQGQSSVVGRQASRGRKSAGVSSPGCWPHAKTRRREEK
ncbi:MAG: hypothetical protein ACK5MS_09575, partial [Planctomyces sp.]